MNEFPENSTYIVHFLLTNVTNTTVIEEELGRISESSTLFKTTALFLSLTRIAGVILGVGLPSLYYIVDYIISFVT